MSLTQLPKDAGRIKMRPKQGWFRAHASVGSGGGGRRRTGFFAFRAVGERKSQGASCEAAVNRLTGRKAENSGRGCWFLCGLDGRRSIFRMNRKAGYLQVRVEDPTGVGVTGESIKEERGCNIMKKRIYAFLLAMCLVLNMFSGIAFATEAEGTCENGHTPGAEVGS